MIRRVLFLLVILVIASTAVAEAAGPRRATGSGRTLAFDADDRVAGEVISLRNANGTWGQTWYRCKHPNPPRGGRVTTGVINYTSAEVTRLPDCRNTQSSPGPRRPTGSGNWGFFNTGEYVLGFAIEVGTARVTYFSCLWKPVATGGRVISGVVNPSRFEMASKTLCQNTTNWNPGPRVQSGDGGNRQFASQDRVVAAFIRLNDGRTFSNCFFRRAPMAGTLWSGVKNYWPGEDKGLSPCA